MIACTAPPSLYIHWNSESMLLVLWRQRCVQAGTQLIFLHDQKMFIHFDNIGHCCAAPFCAVAPAPRPASASPAPRGGPAAPSNLAFPNPSVKGLVLHPAKARETRRCIVVTSLQLLDLASQSVQLDDVCLQAKERLPRAELQLSSQFVS